MRVIMKRRVIEGIRSRGASLARSSKLRAPRQRAVQRLQRKRLQNALNTKFSDRQLTDELVRARPALARARIAVENFAQYIGEELPRLRDELEAWLENMESPTQLPSHPIGSLLIDLLPMHPYPQTVQDLRDFTNLSTLLEDHIEPITRQLISEIQATPEPRNYLKIEWDLIARGHHEPQVKWIIKNRFLRRAGRTPRGWMVTKEKGLVPDLAERRAIKRILELTQQGRGSSEMEKILEEEGIRDRKGETFPAGKISKIKGSFN